MHPKLWEKFGNQLHLNQKFHPNMTGKFLNSQSSLTQTPNYNGKRGEVIMLQTPVQPKARAFFEQAYLGKEDFPKRQSHSQARPFSAYKANDQQTYMSHHMLKQQIENQQKTLDPNYYKKSRKTAKKKAKNEEEDWERFNEELSHKSGFSRRSSKSQNSKFANRIKSAVRANRYNGNGVHNERVGTAHANKRVELTQKNLRDFEEKLSSQAASRRGEKIGFNNRGDGVRNYPENENPLYDGENPDERKDNLEPEGEGDEYLENPNEAENGHLNNEEERQSILGRSEVQSLSKASRKSYVESLRNELQREREKRRELEKQVKELADSRKS